MVDLTLLNELEEASKTDGTEITDSEEEDACVPRPEMTVIVSRGPTVDDRQYLSEWTVYIAETYCGACRVCNYSDCNSSNRFE